MVWHVYTLIRRLMFLQKFTLLYYINTNEIPGELSRENLISSHVKITIVIFTCENITVAMAT